MDTNREAGTVPDMSEGKKVRRPRRSFSDEFKAGAVRLVLERGKTVAEVAHELDLTDSALRGRAERARADAGQGKPGVLTTAEREELTRLRVENRELRVEREILRRAAAFFAKESK